ncbi:MAG: NusG domain II-containing protein [Oscillospiraceae bacterium]|nr:NusG domain II-containing protein [Oscillospiraceae bacterium]
MKLHMRFLILAILIAAVCTGAVFALQHSSGGTIACVTLNGEVIERIDLSAVTEPYSFVVSCPEGDNTVEVKPGAIRITHADCPDQICVSSGWSGAGSLPIVCLPHKLVISFEADTPAEIDGVSGR